jgi:hypothetical protein
MGTNVFISCYLCREHTANELYSSWLLLCEGECEQGPPRGHVAFRNIQLHRLSAGPEPYYSLRQQCLLFTQQMKSERVQSIG